MLDIERVRLKRLMLRLSQKRLGELIGQDQAYVSRLERGHFPEISMTTLERLADALHVSMDFLAGRTDKGLTEESGVESEHEPAAADLVGP
jgi:transcriptional regulator with XRE-family HTH domain